MDGEAIQWLVMTDDGSFDVTSPMTTEEIERVRGGKWYRPLVQYEMPHELVQGVKRFTTEIKDTRHWHDVKKSIETLPERQP
jgi:hypothetical protein